jgi:hypothetical protein
MMGVCGEVEHSQVWFERQFHNRVRWQTTCLGKVRRSIRRLLRQALEVLKGSKADRREILTQRQQYCGVVVDPFVFAG